MDREALMRWVKTGSLFVLPVGVFIWARHSWKVGMPISALAGVGSAFFVKDYLDNREQEKIAAEMREAAAEQISRSQAQLADYGKVKISQENLSQVTGALTVFSPGDAVNE